MRSATSGNEQVDSAFGLIQDIATFGLLLVRRPRWLPIFGEWVTPRSQEALEQVLSDSSSRVSRRWLPWLEVDA